jgi:hypothetical protein
MSAPQSTLDNLANTWRKKANRRVPVKTTMRISWGIIIAFIVCLIVEVGAWRLMR